MESALKPISKITIEEEGANISTECLKLYNLQLEIRQVSLFLIGNR